MAKKRIGKLNVFLGLDAKGFKKALRNAKRSLNKFSRDMKKLADPINRGFTVPILAASAAALKFSTDLNRSMSNVATLIPNSTKRVKELKTEVQSLAIETGKSTADLSDGLYQVVSAFGDSAETVKILELNAKASAAGLSTTADSLNLLSSVTKGYGDISIGAQRKVADLAFTTVKLGQTTFPELASSMGGVVPIARQLNISQEELFATMATLTGVTGNASEVATQMQATMKALIQPTAEMEKVFKRLNVETGEQLIQQYGYQGALVQVSKASKELNIQLAKTYGRKEGLIAGYSLATSQAEVYRSKLEQVRSSTGAMEEAYKEQTQGINKLGHSWERLKQRLAVLAQTVGDALLPAVDRINEAFKPVLETVENLVEAFGKLSPETQKLIIDIGLIVSAFGILGTILGGLATLVVAVFGFIGTAFGVLISPIGLIVAAIGTIVVAFGGISESLVYLQTGAKLAAEKVSYHFQIAANKMNEQWDLALNFMNRKLNKFVKDLGYTLGDVPFLGNWARNLVSSAGSQLQSDDSIAKHYKGLRVNLGKEHVQTLVSIEKFREEEIAAIENGASIDSEKGLLNKAINFAFSNDLDKALSEFSDSFGKASKEVSNLGAQMKKDLRISEPGSKGKPEAVKEVEQIQGALENLASTGKSQFESLREISRDWTDSMSNNWAEMYRNGDFTFKKLGQSFLNNFTDKIFNSFVSQSFNGIFGAIIPGFASGGFAQGLAVVGEQGPELVNFGERGGRVYSNQDSKQILGQGGNKIVVQNEIHVHGNSSNDILNSARELGEFVVNTVVDAQRRGKI